MTREGRTQQLNALRQKSPQRLIATYRAATDTPEPQQLPRGLGFTGMIEAILEHEVATGKVQDEVATGKVQDEVATGKVQDEVATGKVQDEVATGKVQDESQKVFQIVSATTNLCVTVPRRPRAHMIEFRAFCEGGALVFTGLLLAVLYLLLTQQISA